MGLFSGLFGQGAPIGLSPDEINAWTMGGAQMSLAGGPEGEAGAQEKPRRGGLFGRLRNDPAFGDRLRAAIAMMQGDQGAAARFQALQIQRQQEARQQAEAQREIQARDVQVAGAKDRGIPNEVIAGTTANDLSQLVRERSALQRFDAGGGSYFDPLANGGQGAWVTAPSEREVNGAIVRTNQGGTSNVVYDGGHYVPVTEGGGVAVFNHQGRGGWGVAPDSMAGQSLPPPPGLGPVQPQTGAAPSPQIPGPAAEAEPVPIEAPAFRPAPGALAGGPPPTAPRRSAPIGNAVEELSRLAGMPPSSGYRTQGHQDSLVAQGLTRARSSQHTQGNALDFPIPAGPAQQAAAARIRQRYPQARFEFERSNLHVTLPGWGGAPDVSGSRRRYPGRDSGGIPLVRTPADAARLPPGTRFRTPDGQERVRN